MALLLHRSLQCSPAFCTVQYSVMYSAVQLTALHSAVLYSTLQYVGLTPLPSPLTSASLHARETTELN